MIFNDIWSIFDVFCSGVSVQAVTAEWGHPPYALEICGIIIIQEVLHISTVCSIMIVENYKLNVHARGSIVCRNI